MHVDLLEELYLKYKKEVYLYIFSLCKEKELAEEILNDAFIIAFHTLENDNTNFKFWVFRVCKNLWIDYIRKNKIDDRYTIDHFGITSDGTNILDEIISEEKKKVIFELINRLPDNYREVLVLFYFANMNLDEIASLQKISFTNAKTILYRSRVKLKIEMEACDYEF